MKKYISLISFAFILLSCNSHDEKNAANTREEIKDPRSKEHAFTPEMVVNKTDYACGMPTSAGISDTCHIEGKAYGFCSPECMAEFKKDPAKYLAAK